MKIPIREYMKERICTNCGWHGMLGDTVGPHQQREFMTPTHNKEGKKDPYVYWRVMVYFYCPDCFNSQKRTGHAVYAKELKKGYVHEDDV